MSIEKVYDHFNARLSALGFEEWDKPFESENIPATKVEQVFYQEIQNISGDGKGNQDLKVTVRHQVEIYLKGFREVPKALREAAVKAEDIILACLKYSDINPPLLQVDFQDLELVPFDDSTNDRIVLARIVFAVQVNVCLT